jgi:rare lipoprotein A
MSRQWRWVAVAVGVGLLVLAGFGGWRYAGQHPDLVKFRQEGTASWYGPGFHGNKTASGVPYDQNDLTAAHKTLPLGAEVTVIDQESGRSVDVEINDRGPYVPGRHIDLSREAARQLGVLDDGTAKVRIEATPRQLDPDGDGKPGADTK